MRVNLAATRGLIMSERLVFALAERDRADGGARARERGGGARERARHARCATSSPPTGGMPLTAAELDAAFVPETYVGAADVFIDRALDLYRGAELLRLSGTTRRFTSRRAETPAMSLSPATRARTNITSVAPLWSGSLCVGLSVSVAVPSEPVLTSAGVDERPNGQALDEHERRCAPRSRACPRRGSWP